MLSTDTSHRQVLFLLSKEENAVRKAHYGLFIGLSDFYTEWAQPTTHILRDWNLLRSTPWYTDYRDNDLYTRKQTYFTPAECSWDRSFTQHEVAEPNPSL